MNIEKLKSQLREANKAYRLTANPIIPDDEFDELLESLQEEISTEDFNDFLDVMRKDTILGSKRKEKLPYVMASLDKVKTVAEVKQWVKSNNLSMNTEVVLTPKYDGLSLLVDEEKVRSWTSGDGGIGQTTHEHFAKMITGGCTGKGLTFGEAIMKVSLFEKKYSEDVLGEDEGYKNPRNTVSGQLTKDEASSLLKDIYYIRYAIPNSTDNKLKQLQDCNKVNPIPVPYKIVLLSELTDEMLVEIHRQWKQTLDMQLDGIVIDVNDPKIRQTLGRHKSTDNPNYAVAYKGNFEEIKQAKVTGIITKVSKLGYVIPVVTIEPTKLDGATVSKASLYNYKTVIDMNIGTGAIVTIKRSGQVIPKVINVIKQSKAMDIPTHCPSCNSQLDWNETNVHLVCENPNCPSQRLQRIIAFFNIMKVEEVSKGILKLLYDNGYDTIEKILKVTEKELKLLPTFGDRRAEIVYTNIQAKIKNVNLSKLMHASGCFRILGSRKLALVEHLYEENPSVEVLKTIKGFSEKSANAYIKGAAIFKQFIKTLPVTIQKGKKEMKKPTSSKCNNMIFVFTGFRDDILESKIKDAGGEIGNGVNKKTTHLVMKVKGSGTSKEQKAIDFGITIWEKSELEDFLY